MTAIAFCVFNRPELTRISFERIRQQRPDQLFLIADGPRPDHPTDGAQCAATREVLDDIDWSCEVNRDYAAGNLGLKHRMTSGLDWVFSQVERAIVLEDDCVANPDFFRFCGEMLARYEKDPRVFLITGNNFQSGVKRGEAAYYFSKYTHVWGWASWRRAWELYDRDMSFWPSWRTSPSWLDIVPDPVERDYWAHIFDRVTLGKIDSWAYPFLASAWYHNALSATPNVNLVSNIGFGPEATHTKGRNNASGLRTEPIGPMTHPSQVAPDQEADAFAFDTHFNGAALRARSRPLGFIRATARFGARFVQRNILGLGSDSGPAPTSDTSGEVPEARTIRIPRPEE